MKRLSSSVVELRICYLVIMIGYSLLFLASCITAFAALFLTERIGLTLGDSTSIVFVMERLRP